MLSRHLTGRQPKRRTRRPKRDATAAAHRTEPGPASAVCGDSGRLHQRWLARQAELRAPQARRGVGDTWFHAANGQRSAPQNAFVANDPPRVRRLRMSMLLSSMLLLLTDATTVAVQPAPPRIDVTKLSLQSASGSKNPGPTRIMPGVLTRRGMSVAGTREAEGPPKR